jgi:hypothetical protein
MKRVLSAAIVIFSIMNVLNAQGLKGILNKMNKPDSTGRSPIGKVLTNVSSYKIDSLTNNQVVAGLKEALQVGTERSAGKLSSADGFFKDAALKILMPQEAVKAEQTLRKFGFGKQVDNAILSMNRAAEDATKNAVPIFVNAIKQMSIQDAVGILKGGDSSATKYLRSKTALQLSDAFKPIIQQSLSKVDATKYWNTVFTTYNKFSTNPVNTDLTAYVTERALTGIFYQVGLEEQKIRKDPVARTTDILKQVFGTKL